MAAFTLGNSTPEPHPPTQLAVFAGRGRVGRIDAPLLDLSADQTRLVDRRLAVAACVAILLDSS